MKNDKNGKGKRKALILIAIYSLLTVADLTLTRIGTPDLSLEANPMVRDFGFAWGGLIALNFISVLFFAIFVYYSYVIYTPPVIIADNEMDFKKKLGSSFGFASIFALFGYCIGYSLIISRIIPVVEWVFYILNFNMMKYFEFRDLLPVGRFDLVVAGFLSIIFGIIWLVRDEKTVRRISIIETDESVDVTNE